jgi:hypothetical protein
MNVDADGEPAAGCGRAEGVRPYTYRCLPVARPLGPESPDEPSRSPPPACVRPSRRRLGRRTSARERIDPAQFASRRVNFQWQICNGNPLTTKQ